MAEPDDTASVKHSQSNSENYAARWFTAESLRQIDAELRKGAFDEVKWQLTDDHHGEHHSSSLTSLLDQVPWTQVTRFAVGATQHVYPEPYVPGMLKSAYVSVDHQHVYWSADEGADVEGTRLAVQRVRDVIEALPKSGYRSRFGSPPKPWWTRPPEGLTAWAAVGASLVVVGGFVLALILKLAGAF